MSPRFKIDVVHDISAMIGISAPHMSTGSTEPRDLFDAVNLALGLGLEQTLTKPEMARAIVEASGENWLGSYESRGGTVTLEGLEAVFDAVRLFTGGSGK